MLKKITFLLIIFGAWGIFELIPTQQSDINAVNKLNLLLQNFESNMIIYNIIKVSIKANRFISILPLFLGLLILYKKYAEAYFVTKLILFLKVIFFPSVLFVISKHFILNLNLIALNTTRGKANIIAFILTVIMLMLIISLYVWVLVLLKKQLSEDNITQ